MIYALELDFDKMQYIIIYVHAPCTACASDKNQAKTLEIDAKTQSRPCANQIIPILR